MDRFFAIVNPAAGGGRSAKLAGPALAHLREKGLKIDVIATTSQGHGVQLAREAYDQGYHRFLAVGGDGTAHEILNGVFAGRSVCSASRWVFCRWAPEILLARFYEGGSGGFDTGADRGPHAEVLTLLRLTHAAGQIFSFNLLSVVSRRCAALTNRMFNRLAPRVFAGRFCARGAAAPAIHGAALRMTMRSGMRAFAFRTFNIARISGEHDC